MEYREYTLIDHGYTSPDVPGVEPLPEIMGLDNRPGERFVHRGVTGYPELPDGARIVAELHDPAGNDHRCLAAGVGLSCGEEVATGDVTALLVASYGWPVGTSLDDDGWPVRPQEV